MPRSKDTTPKNTSNRKKVTPSKSTEISKPKSSSKSPTKSTTKRKPKSSTKSQTKNIEKPKENIQIVDKKEELKFHEVFPIKLEHTDKQLKEKKICYFQCKEHLNSYIKRYKLKKAEYTISDTEPR